MTFLSRARSLHLSILLGVALVLLSLLPGESQNDDSAFSWIVVITPTILQKSMHVALYASFALLLASAQRRDRNLAARLMLASLTAFSLGTLLEWLQLFVPGRFGTLTDVVLNAIGIAVGITIGFKVLTTDPVRQEQASVD